ncbi:hypothetical protein LMG31886_22020 [Xanthomonas hydrangeae]|nr:hypothetical protein LMG31886_22020 [Xanthomonas hydrangeae]CAD7735145.1 hypothetical protein LMG31886_22020 [Xanthomonas hydrangeae]CAD7744651.1 hypothetical protein LMG31885_38210 [Xanthomonas hydrangeae]CAD7744654.1 hypothetical protein LMG31885_38210 [Xanthomonas hydrangeae]
MMLTGLLRFIDAGDLFSMSQPGLSFGYPYTLNLTRTDYPSHPGSGMMPLPE